MDWVWLLFLLRAFGSDVRTKLVVNWWTANDVAAISRQTSGCGEEPQKPDSFTATLMVCSGSDPFATPGPGATSNCEAKETRTLSTGDRAGALVFEDIPRGLHVLEFKAGTIPPVIRRIRVYGDEKTAEEQVEQGEVVAHRIFPRKVANSRSSSISPTVRSCHCSTPRVSRASDRPTVAGTRLSSLRGKRCTCSTTSTGTTPRSASRRTTSSRFRGESKP
jgi:hypothetical protein